MDGQYWRLPVATYLVYFQDETERVLDGWDKTIGLESVPGELDWMYITKPLPCGDSYIRPIYKYNGASVGPLRDVPIFGFPKWRHPIATGRHDFLCDLIALLLALGLISKREAKRLRKIADKKFHRDVGLGQTSKMRSWWEQTKGYVGVRIGATLGIGGKSKGTALPVVAH